jgi:hypothetical protein
MLIATRALSNRALSDSGRLSRTFTTEARNASSLAPSILGPAQAESMKMAATDSEPMIERPTRARARCWRMNVKAMIAVAPESLTATTLAGRWLVSP